MSSNDTKRGILMWNSKRSVLLSLIVTYFFAGVLLALIVTAPWLFPFYVKIAGRADFVSTVLIAAFYACAPAAIAAILSLLKLLYNIRKEEVFIPQNITSLRILSWCCFYVAVVCFVACFFYFPLAIIAFAAVFFGLILRVIKNVFVCATELKDENDLTI